MSQAAASTASLLPAATLHPGRIDCLGACPSNGRLFEGEGARRRAWSRGEGLWAATPRQPATGAEGARVSLRRCVRRLGTHPGADQRPVSTDVYAGFCPLHASPHSIPQRRAHVRQQATSPHAAGQQRAQRRAARRSLQAQHSRARDKVVAEVMAVIKEIAGIEASGGCSGQVVDGQVRRDRSHGSLASCVIVGGGGEGAGGRGQGGGAPGQAGEDARGALQRAPVRRALRTRAGCPQQRGHGVRPAALDVVWVHLHVLDVLLHSQLPRPHPADPTLRDATLHPHAAETHSWRQRSRSWASAATRSSAARRCRPPPSSRAAATPTRSRRPAARGVAPRAAPTSGRACWPTATRWVGSSLCHRRELGASVSLHLTAAARSFVRLVSGGAIDLASVTITQQVSQHVTGRDRLALEYLRDVRRVGGRNGEAPGIELAFDPKARLGV